MRPRHGRGECFDNSQGSGAYGRPYLGFAFGIALRRRCPHRSGVVDTRATTPGRMERDPRGHRRGRGVRLPHLIDGRRSRPRLRGRSPAGGGSSSGCVGRAARGAGSQAARVPRRRSGRGTRPAPPTSAPPEPPVVRRRIRRGPGGRRRVSPRRRRGARESAGEREGEARPGSPLAARRGGDRRPGDCLGPPCCARSGSSRSVRGWVAQHRRGVAREQGGHGQCRQREAVGHRSGSVLAVGRGTAGPPWSSGAIRPHGRPRSDMANAATMEAERSGRHRHRAVVDRASFAAVA